MTTTPSGLEYEDITVGSGEEARAGQRVQVHYTGWLYDPTAPKSRGQKFDSSKDRGQPFAFGLGEGQVIRGWDEGVQGMKVGGTRVLTIPAELGYGARGAGGVIPPNATLVFEVDLISRLIAQASATMKKAPRGALFLGAAKLSAPGAGQPC